MAQRAVLRIIETRTKISNYYDSQRHQGPRSMVTNAQPVVEWQSRIGGFDENVSRLRMRTAECWLHLCCVDGSAGICWPEASELQQISRRCCCFGASSVGDHSASQDMQHGD